MQPVSCRHRAGRLQSIGIQSLCHFVMAAPAPRRGEEKLNLMRAFTAATTAAVERRKREAERG